MGRRRLPQVAASVAFAALGLLAAPPDAPGRDRIASITFSPLDLAYTTVEATVEIRAFRRFGVAVIGGYGIPRLLRAGAQGRWYAIGEFDNGGALGIQLLHEDVIGLDTYSSWTRGDWNTADNVSAGPFIACKLTAPSGFLFDAQLGVEWYQVLHPNAETDYWDVRSGPGIIFLPPEHRLLSVEERGSKASCVLAAATATLSATTRSRRRSATCRSTSRRGTAPKIPLSSSQTASRQPRVLLRK